MKLSLTGVDSQEVRQVLGNKYNIALTEEEFDVYIIGLKNKVYKLLPLREEGLEWEKYLNTVLVEVSGLSTIFKNKTRLISLLSKLEGLYRLDDFASYRRTIFECLNLIEDLR